MNVFIYALLFALGLLIYALAYMLVPLMICKRKKPLTDWQIVKILLVNGPVAWVAISALVGEVKSIIVAGVFMLIFSTADYFIMETQSRLARARCSPKSYTPKFTAQPTETVRVQLARVEEKNYGNYNGKLKDLELKPTIEEKEKPSDDEKLTENRKQLVNLAMNVPEDKVDIALKLLRTLN